MLLQQLMAVANVMRATSGTSWALTSGLAKAAQSAWTTSFSWIRQTSGKSNTPISLDQENSGLIPFSSSPFQAALLPAPMMLLNGCSRTSIPRPPLSQSTSPTRTFWAKISHSRSLARHTRLKAKNTKRTLCSSLQVLSFQKLRNWHKLVSLPKPKPKSRSLTSIRRKNRMTHTTIGLTPSRERDQDQVQVIKVVIPPQITNLMQAIHMHPDPTLQTPFALKKNPPLLLLAKKKRLARNFNAIRMHPTSWSLISRLASASTTHLCKVVALKLDSRHARVKNRKNFARLSRSTITLMRAIANASALKLTLALLKNLTKVRALVATKFAPQTLLLQTLTLPSNLVHVSALKIATI